MITAQEASKMTKSFHDRDEKLKQYEALIDAEIRAAAEKGENNVLITLNIKNAIYYGDKLIDRLKENGFKGCAGRDLSKYILSISW